MEDKKILLDNIVKIHTTEMGVDRIRRNLKLAEDVDVVDYCRQKILNSERTCYIADPEGNLIEIGFFVIC